MTREAKIREMAPEFKIESIWGHAWDQLKQTKEVSTFLNSIQLTTPMNPRDALYGGRTNALKLHHRCIKPGENIKYIDYTSLYPYVQKYGVYPIGHPIILTENIDINKGYFGLIKCKVLPPRGLYIPVLPVRINGKLLFPLCKTCAEPQNEETCTHSNEERVLEGTWCSLEIDAAKQNGYLVENIYEIWHWETKAQYNREAKTEGIFEKYVDQALKEKQEASGFPESCVTESDKDSYIKDYYEHEGILLDKSKIEKNPGRRQVAKLKANSLWGYFALNSDRKSFKIITNQAEWLNMVSNDQYIIHDVNAKNPDFIQVQYSERREFNFGGLTTNVVIAAFVTCQARLKLFSELLKLQKRVLYFDTDSIFFVSNPEDTYQPELGDYLGDFTSEIDPREGNYIEEFVSAGPKNYAYKLDTGVTHCTVKGITFNSLTVKVINFESIRDIVCSDKRLDQLLEVPQLKFLRDRDRWQVNTDVQTKKYRFVYDKRVIQPDLTTLPYGY